ncbi:acyl-ACP desaturase [Fodinicurvata sediminis]|uniref:acyl-ACP desaturase n=1 Tax=Fodinicurvata sediminis TaxID=1121832 RepID=UPI0003B3CB05|nr:ferritin-like domain-containing protein [Fodinicurvata sediminis]
MSAGHWTLDDIDWNSFDRSKIDTEMVKLIKAASLVEYNGDDYADYLCNVFSDDTEFQQAARQWASEEVQHGEALGRWAQMVDPEFDFDSAVKRFRDGFTVDVDASSSVRGSRCGELVARCIVEVGTSSYYGSLADSTDEPVLKDICQRIAADELRHYKLFYTHLRRYLDQERIGKIRRLMIALGRVRETEDDELAYAYYAANTPANEDYDRKRWSKAYMNRALAIYKPVRVERAAAMTCKAAGLNPRGRTAQLLSKAAYHLMKSKQQKAEAATAAAA